MNIFQLIILILLFINILLIVIMMIRRRNNNDIFNHLNTQFLEFQKDLNENMHLNKSEMEHTKDIISANTLKTVEMIKELSGTIARLTDEQKHSTKLTEDLKYLFQKPKARGNYTEIVLEEMLKRVLPEGIWHKQYNISGTERERVDFAIEYNNSIIPIDVKFPTDDYNRYVSEDDRKLKSELWNEFIKKLKMNIKDISAKYIKPEKGTSEFALMFIPTDSIYFDAISTENTEGFANTLFDFAQQNKVLLAGPSTFYAFLQIIIAGLRNIEIFKNTKTLLENIKKLERNMEHFSSKYEDIGNKLQKAREAYDVGNTHFDRIRKNSSDILKLDKNTEQITKE